MLPVSDSARCVTRGPKELGLYGALFFGGDRLNHDQRNSGWWFQRFFYFHPGGRFPILTSIFSDGLKPPTRTVKTPNINRESENDVFFF